MRLLMDTNAALFFFGRDSRLSEFAYTQVTAPDSEVYISAISCAELACLQEKRKITIAEHWKPWFRTQLAINSWGCLPITLEVLEEAFSLPDFSHRDPADRIIIATARLERLTIVTADKIILNYPHISSLS